MRDEGSRGWLSEAQSPAASVLVQAARHFFSCARTRGRRAVNVWPSRVQITSLAFTPDGRSLVSGGEDGALMLWDLGEAKGTAAAAGGHQGAVWALACSRGDGSILASGALGADLA
jgi:WD40 repeat protein